MSTRLLMKLAGPVPSLNKRAAPVRLLLNTARYPLKTRALERLHLRHEYDVIITSVWQSLFAEHSKGAAGALVRLILQARGQDESALSTRTCLHQERRPLCTEYERFVQGCILFTSSWVDIRAA